MFCNKILLIVVCMITCVCIKAEAIDQATELEIIKGMSKRNLKDRRPYIYKTYTTYSKSIFDKLARMYKIDNEIREDVFYAMKSMNIYSQGKFCKELLEVLDSEFYRLKNRREKNRPELDYLHRCFYIFLKKPFKGFDNYVKNFLNDCHKYIEFSNNYDKDKKYFQGLCILYFAKRNRRGYMAKLADIYKNNTIGHDSDIVKLFTLHKDSSIYDAYTEGLLKEKDFMLAREFDDYTKYCKAINKKVPSKIKKIHDDYIKRRALETKDLFEDD